MKKIISIAVVFLLTIVAIPTVHAEMEDDVMYWQCTTNSEKWSQKDNLNVTEWDNDTSLYIQVDSSARYQRLTQTPFGGCFNERGWEAMKDLTEEQREKIIYRVPKNTARQHIGSVFEDLQKQ